MSGKKLTIAAVSPKISVGNVTKNCDEILNIIDSTKDKNIDVIVFPELTICGCTCGDLLFHQTLIDACENAIGRIVDYTKNCSCHIIIGSPFKSGECLYNSAFHIYKGEILQIVSKKNLSHMEKRWFATGFEKNNVQDFKIIIGDDLYSDNSVKNFIIHIDASPALVTCYDYQKSFVEKYTENRNCAYVYASAGPNESTTDFVYPGTCLVAEKGKIISEVKRFSFDSEIIINEIELCKPNDTVSPIIIDKYSANQFDTHPFIPSDKEELMSRCKEIIEIQCTGLAKRMLHIHCNKLVLGISGGLDSTHALLVCVETMKKLNIPPENLICITMPGFGTTNLTYTNACNLVKSLGATLLEISIKDACLKHFDDIGHDFNIHDITYENTQARERTQILMDYGNKIGAIVVGTGDLSELALGWCTYNGDHMSMYGVNASIPKTLMRHLVRYIANNSDETTSKILYSVLDTPVSPELLPLDKNGKMVQKTENTLGPYDVHDYFIYHFVRHKKSPEELLQMAVNAFNGIYTEKEIRNWLTIFIRRFFNNQFKRSCMPDGVAVGTVSLSPRGAFIMPSDACYDEWTKF